MNWLCIITTIPRGAWGCACESPSRANGAKILVDFITPTIMQELGVAPERPRPWHVVVLPQEEWQLLEVLAVKRRSCEISDEERGGHFSGVGDEH